MTPLLTAAALAAAAGTPHCVGMCGGLATAASDQLPYQVGRIGTYAGLGAIAGAVGLWIPGPSWVGTALSGALVVGMAASLAGWLPEPKVRIPGTARLGRSLVGRTGPAASLGLGVLNGLLPCGLLYGTLALPVASGDAGAGAVIMVTFGLLTAVPLTVASRGLRHMLDRRGARQVLALMVLVSGIAGLSMRAPSLDGNTAEQPACHTP